MIAAWLVALAGLALFAMGTPRQAHLIAGPHIDRRTRLRARLAGSVVLAISLALAVGGSDWGRHAMAWIGMVGLTAAALATTIASVFRPAPGADRGAAPDRVRRRPAATPARL